MNKPLYALVEQYRELQTLDPEEIDSQMLNDTLEALGGEIQEKAKNVACFARNIESFADQVDEAAAQMKERAKRLRDKATGIRGYILNQMRGAGITKIQAPEFTVAIRKNPPAVQIKSDAVIPSEYLVKPEPPAPYPDKQKIKDALKAGVVIDGVSLEQAERLDIR
jgi:hypothetical protein